MDWAEVEERIQRGEDDTTEFKRWEAFPARVGEALCAMVNSGGGVIVLGVSDDGQVLGVPGPAEEIQERLTTFLQTGLSAPVRARLGYHAHPDGVVHWIEVGRMRGPEPLRYRDRILVRRGRSSHGASGAELQDLFNTFGFVFTEEQAVPGTSVKDVDEESFRLFQRRQGLALEDDPQPTLEEDLRARGILVQDDGQERVSLYGILCFGRDPQLRPPLQNLRIQCCAYGGLDRSTSVLLSGDARGRVDEQVERALGWMEALGQREEYGDLHRRDLPVVPRRALREVLVNAVAHRDYALVGSPVLLDVFADRVEVTSPGPLPNRLTPDAVLHGGQPRSRNEWIANFLLVKGLMESRGRGLPVVRREMREYNGTEPRLESDREARFVRLTMWR